MRHRYIFSGICSGSDKISKFRLISSCTRHSLGGCIRVNIPDDLELSHYPGDSYSTTFDNRTLDELGYDCYIYYKGKWRKFNYLKQFQPHEWWLVLENIFSLYNCINDIGYTDDYNYFQQWYKNKISGFILESEIVYPRFKEDKKGLDLPIKIKHSYRDDSKLGYKWYKVFLELKDRTEI